jgi:hypothetical protein
MTTSPSEATTPPQELIYDAVATEVSRATAIPMPWLYDTTMSLSDRDEDSPGFWWRLIDLGGKRESRVRKIARAFAYADGGAWFVARENPHDREEWWGVAAAPWEPAWKIARELRLNRATIACPHGGWANGRDFPDLRQRLEWLLQWTYRLDELLLAVRTIASGRYVRPWHEHVSSMGHLVLRRATCLKCKKPIWKDESVKHICRGHAKEAPLWSLLK